MTILVRHHVWWTRNANANANTHCKAHDNRLCDTTRWWTVNVTLRWVAAPVSKELSSSLSVASMPGGEILSELHAALGQTSAELVPRDLAVHLLHKNKPLITWFKPLSWEVTVLHLLSQ